MTNILQLPRLSSATTFAVTTNSQWTDQIPFVQAGWPAPFSLAGCALVNGSGTVTCPTTAQLIPGLVIAPGPGIPVPSVGGSSGFCVVLAIISQIAFTLGDSFGNPLNATATNPGAILTFNPPPLDLTGINFISSVAPLNTPSPRLLLTAQTSDGSMLVYPKQGILQYNVAQAAMAQILPGTYGVDIIAFDTQFNVNLFPQGPATITVSAGVSSLYLTTQPTTVPPITPPTTIGTVASS